MTHAYAATTMHGAPTHSMRTYRGCNAPSTGAFTRGNRRGFTTGISPQALNADLGITLTSKIPVRVCARPMRNMPDPKVKIVRAARIWLCGSCGCVAHPGECW